MIPINNPVGEFKVWTKSFGSNRKMKILLFYVLGNFCGGILAMEYALK
jgi:hypothetical protein